MQKLIENSLKRLINCCEAEGYSGYDPYDGLNSYLAKIWKNKYWRMFLTQGFKKSSVNLRPLSGIKKDYNPKAMGLFASGYLLNYQRTGDERYLEKAKVFLDWLIENYSKGYRGYCWGYNFNWQSKVFFISKETPNVVCTSFIANAFLDAYELLGERKYLDIARSSCDFILNDLNRTYLSEVFNDQSPMTNDLDSFCFSYTPLDNTCVHNANLLGAELFSRVYFLTKEKLLLDYAIRAVKFTLRHQNRDSSWYYGLDPKQRWIDNFHTGFVLVSLYNFIKYTNTANDSECKRILMRGYGFYKENFFLDDGTPKYYHNRLYPIDIHNVAQGIITFLKFRKEDSEALEMAKRIILWGIDNFQSKKGYFYYQKYPLFTNKITYIRWSQAWMFYALSLLLSYRVLEPLSKRFTVKDENR